MKSAVIKRSIVIAGHKTSVSLEDAFWKALKEIAGGRHMTLSDLVAAIDTGRQHRNLSSAIRLFVLEGREASVPAVADPGAPAEETPRAERPADARVVPPSPPQHPRPTARVQKPKPSVGEPLQLMPYQLWFGVR